MRLRRPRFLSSEWQTCHGAHPRIGGGEHVVAGAGVVVPVRVRLEVHVRQLPDLARVVDPALQPPRLLVLTDLEPVLEEQ